MTARPAIRSQAAPRIEYLGFRNVEEAREYRYAVHSGAGSCEFRYRIELGDLARAHLLIQDGPDVCYQQLAREVAGGDTQQEGARCIREEELNAYRVAHTPASRAATAWSAGSPPRPAPPATDGNQ